MPTLSISKLANALIPNATPSALVPSVARAAVEGVGNRCGGLWVGGRIHVSNDGVSFTPNRLNQAFHVALEVVRIPFADIHSATRMFGWVTGIVVIKHKGGEFRFRCYGASRVAACISEHLNKP
jgi:hypothetical protein